MAQIDLVEDFEMKQSEVLEFLKSDLGFMTDAFNQEIKYSKDNLSNIPEEEKEFEKGYIAGLKLGLQMAQTWYEIRLDEGF